MRLRLRLRLRLWLKLRLKLRPQEAHEHLLLQRTLAAMREVENEAAGKAASRGAIILSITVIAADAATTAATAPATASATASAGLRCLLLKPTAVCHVSVPAGARRCSCCLRVLAPILVSPISQIVPVRLGARHVSAVLLHVQPVTALLPPAALHELLACRRQEGGRGRAVTAAPRLSARVCASRPRLARGGTDRIS